MDNTVIYIYILSSLCGKLKYPSDPTETAASTAETGPLTPFKERQLTSEEFLANQWTKAFLSFNLPGRAVY